LRELLDETTLLGGCVVVVESTASDLGPSESDVLLCTTLLLVVEHVVLVSCHSVIFQSIYFTNNSRAS
jgi:hypothetical protein